MKINARENRSRGFFCFYQRHCNAIFHYFPYGKYRITKSTHKNSAPAAKVARDVAKICQQRQVWKLWKIKISRVLNLLVRLPPNINFTINFSVSLVIYNLQSFIGWLLYLYEIFHDFQQKFLPLNNRSSPLFYHLPHFANFHVFHTRF